MASFLLLVAPLPRAVRRKTLNFISTSALFDNVKLGLKFTFVFILVLFIDSVNRVYRVQVELGRHMSAAAQGMGANMIAVDRSEIQARKFYAQRNMYLCGFTLFLSLILNRTYVLVVDLLHAEDKLKALGASSNASVKADAIASESKDEVSKLKKELEQKNKDIEALKKQAANLSAEYNRVSDELNAKEGISARTKSD
jgi:hypothetical protein